MIIASNSRKVVCRLLLISVCFLAITFCISLLSSASFSQDNAWEKHFKLAESAMTAGSYLKADDHIRTAVSIAERSYKNDPRLALSWHTLAENSRILGYFDEAYRYYEKAIKLFEDTLGPAHPWTRRTALGIGGMYADLGYYNMAEKIYQGLLIEQLKRPTEDNLTIIVLTSSAADLYSEVGRLDEAEALLHRALTLIEKDGDAILWSMVTNGIAAIYRDRGKYDEALILYSETLSLAIHNLNSGHPGIAAIHNGLGTVLRYLQRYEEAREHHTFALEIILKSSGTRSPSYAQILLEFGLLESAIGNIEVAERKLLESIAIKEKIFGRNHPFVADAMMEYAAVLREGGKIGESNVVRSEAEEIRENINGKFDVIPSPAE